MRQPAVAGRFYPDDSDALRNIIEACFLDSLASGLPGPCRGEGRIRAALAPHAGYMASGMTAARTFKEIAEDGRHRAYIVIGPDHHGAADGTVLCNQDFATPLGVCETDRVLLERLDLRVDNRAHMREHSIEVMVPFIQYIDPGARIVPVMMGDQSLAESERLGHMLSDAFSGEDVVYLASSDMTHYMPRELVRSHMETVAEVLVKKDIPGMYDAIRRCRMTVCGHGPIAAAVTAADPSEIEVVRMSDSWDSLRYDKEEVVGYLSAVMRRGPPV